MLKIFHRMTPPTKIFLHRFFLANTPSTCKALKRSRVRSSEQPGRRSSGSQLQREKEKYATNANGGAIYVRMFQVYSSSNNVGGVLLSLSLSLSLSLCSWLPELRRPGCSLDRTRDLLSTLQVRGVFAKKKKIRCKNIFVGGVILRKIFNTKISIMKI